MQEQIVNHPYKHFLTNIMITSVKMKLQTNALSEIPPKTMYFSKYQLEMELSRGHETIPDLKMWHIFFIFFHMPKFVRSS